MDMDLNLLPKPTLVGAYSASLVFGPEDTETTLSKVFIKTSAGAFELCHRMFFSLLSAPLFL